MALLAIQRVDKTFAGICAVFYFVLIFVCHYLKKKKKSIQGNVNCIYIYIYILISILSTSFSKHTEKIVNKIGLRTHDPEKTSVDHT